MAVEERKTLIKDLEHRLNARVLTVVTGDRLGMETRIAPDILPLVSEHLAKIRTTEQIALFIYTPGGDSIAGWGLVNLLREYCKRFIVLVPFRALSCGTLIALGADEILMGKHGLLSPIDPSVASPFNPQAPGQQPGLVNLLQVSVEDMIGFLDLARNEVGLKTDESMASVLKILADKVHPLALGAVYRAREHNSSVALRLLSLHSREEEKNQRIVKRLARELPTHSYLIGRREAKDEMGLNVVDVTDEVEDLMWALYEEYKEWLLLTSPNSPELDLGEATQKQVRYERAVVESLDNGRLTQHIFITDKALMKVKITPPGMQSQVDQIAERILYQGWVAAIDGEKAKWR